MLHRLVWPIASFATPFSVLAVAYLLVPDWLLAADYRDRLSDEQLADSALTVFRLGLSAMIQALGLAAALGLVWGWTGGRSHARSDEEAASKKVSWWGFLGIVISAVSFLFWWHLSRADLPQNSIALVPLLTFPLLTGICSAALYWLASYLSAIPRMYPSIPFGIAVYRRWTHMPDQERRRSS